MFVTQSAAAAAVCGAIQVMGFNLYLLPRDQRSGLLKEFFELTTRSHFPSNEFLVLRMELKIVFFLLTQNQHFSVDTEHHFKS